MLKYIKYYLLLQSTVLLLIFSSLSFALTPSIKDYTYDFKNTKDPKYTIKVKYPQLEDTSKESKRFNQYIVAFLKNQITLFQKGLRTPIPALRDASSSLDIDYKVTYFNFPKWISIKFTRFTNYVGMAHPMTITITLNYDLQTGKPLSLSDLFEAKSHYLDNIASYSRKILHTRKLGEHSFIVQGAKATLDNYHNWNITKQGLLISFDPYQVAAYAYGPQVVDVPFDVFAKYLKSEYREIWQQETKTAPQ